MTKSEQPHLDVPTDGEGLVQIDVAEVPEPETPAEGDIEPGDDYAEGAG